MRGIPSSPAGRFVSVLTSVTLLLGAFGMGAPLSFATPAPSKPAPVPHEVVSKRDAFSRTVDNGDGSFTFQSGFSPLNYKASDGSFQPIDPSLQSTSGPSGIGWANRGDWVRTALPSRISSGFVSLETSQGRVSWRPLAGTLPDEARTADVSGAPVPSDPYSVKYAGSFSPADLEYTSVREGIKETIVVPRMTGVDTYSFQMLAPGMTPQVDSGGALLLRSNATSNVVYSFAKPHMWDSSVSTAGLPAESYNVAWRVSRFLTGWRVDLVADSAWLSSPARVYPVRIDPTALSLGTFGTYHGDAYVKDTSPDTNFGNDWIGSGPYHDRLEVGYSPVHGTNCIVLRPYFTDDLLNNLHNGSWRITDATLKLYCYYRYSGTGVGPVDIKSFPDRWAESTITWNTFQAGIAKHLTDLNNRQYAQASTNTTWQVAPTIENWVEQWPANDVTGGFELSCPGGSNNETEFDGSTSPNNNPTLSIRYTPAPEVKMLTPTSDVPVSGVPKARWSYFHNYQQPNGTTLATPESRVQVQVKDEWNSKVTSIAVDTTGSVLALPLPPSGGWADGKRYLARLRAAGIDSAGAQLAWSDWTDWSAFTYTGSLNSVRSGSTLEPYRAALPVSGGLAVDLANGALHGSSTDFTGPGLGTPLSLSTYYDSRLTTDAGVGRGWRISSPSLVASDQQLPAATAAMDTTGPWSTVLSSATLATSSQGVTGSVGSLVVNVTSSGAATLAAPAYASNPIRTWPGERVTGSVWTRYAGSAAATVTPELVFTDSSATTLSVLAGEPVRVGAGWSRLTIATDAPSWGYGVRLALKVASGAGAVSLDSAELRDGSIVVTDGDGTVRTLRPAGDGAYARDPLAPGLAFARVDRTNGATVTASTDGTSPGSGFVTGASLNGATTGIGATSTVDRVPVRAGGTSYLEYSLDQTRALSGAEVYLQQTVLGGPASYTWKMTTVDAAGNESTLTAVDTTTTTGWVNVRFAPRVAKTVRIYALGATGAADLRVAELELPVLTLSDQFVAFDPTSGRLAATADESENLTKYTYDDSGRLTATADPVGRRIDIAWNAGTTDVYYAGADSSGNWSSREVARYRSDASNTYVEHDKGGGNWVAAATYHYSAGNVIDKVTDADGVSTSIGWNGASVSTVTGSGAPTPTVMTITYSSPSTTTVTCDGGSAATRVTKAIGFDPNNGYQVTTTTVDPSGLRLTSTATLDEYGHPLSSTDPEGHTNTYIVDAHGNTWLTSESGMRTESDYYQHDHVYRSLDEKGNVSTYSYDTAWRPLVTSFAVSDSDSDGKLSATQTYDQWGNQVTGELPGSTAYNLLDNSQFEVDPFSGTGGWCATGTPTPTWDPVGVSEPYHGNRCITLTNGNNTGTSVCSTYTPVVAGQAYTISAQVIGAGELWVREYTSGGTFLREVFLSDISTDGTDQGFSNVTARYVPSAGVSIATVKFHCQGDPAGAALEVDNVRLTKSNAPADVNIVDNDSFERAGAPGAPPIRWWQRTSGTGTMAAVSGGVSGSTAVQIQSQNNSTGYGYYYTDYLPVSPGETYTAGGWISTDHLSGAPTGGAWIELRWYASDKSAMDYGLTKQVSTVCSGTTDFTRYSRNVTVPSGAAYVKMWLYASYANGSSTFDSVFMRPAAGNATYAYDSATHTFLVRTDDQLGHVTESDYDAQGRVTASRFRESHDSAASNEVANTYDGLGRLATVTVAPGTLDITSHYGYSDAGRLTSVTDPLSRTSTVQYDAAGRPATSTSPGGWVSRLAYDGLGRVASTYRPALASRPSTLSSSNTYDSAGRLARTDLYDTSGTAIALSSVTTYDKDSKPTSVQLSGESTASATMGYDTLDRSVAVTQTSVAGSTAVSTTLDIANLATHVGLASLGATWGVDNVFAKTGQQVSVKATGGSLCSFAFTGDGKLASMTSTLSAIQTGYDAAGRLKFWSTQYSLDPGNTWNHQTQLFGEWALAYDGRERLSTLTDESSGDTQQFGYDAADRLTSWSQAYGSSATYAYDAAGNLTTRVQDGVTTTFGHDLDDRLTTAVAGSVVTTFSYDDLGRMASRSTGTTLTTYSWDTRSKLATVASAGTTVTYAYDVSGLPARRVATVSGVASSTTYAWSGGKLAAERFADGTLYRFVYGPGGMPLQLLETTPQGATNTYAYQLDPLGDVVGITGTKGSYPAMYRYDPWGACTTVWADSSVAVRNPLRYRGYFYDADLALYVLPARVYDPSLARFLSRDPDVSTAISPRAMNRYAYCEGNPVGNSDPSGTDSNVPAVGTIEYRGDGSIYEYFGGSKGWICIQSAGESIRLSTQNVQAGGKRTYHYDGGYYHVTGYGYIDYAYLARLRAEMIAKRKSDAAHNAGQKKAAVRASAEVSAAGKLLLGAGLSGCGTEIASFGLDLAAVGGVGGIATSETVVGGVAGAIVLGLGLSIAAAGVVIDQLGLDMMGNGFRQAMNPAAADRPTQLERMMNGTIPVNPQNVLVPSFNTFPPPLGPK